MPRPGLPLVHFNDTCCGSVAELRSIILKARRLADDDGSKNGRSSRLRPGFSPRSRKDDPSCRRISRTRHRTSRSAPNASPPSDRPQQPTIRG
jgi:hypothetical protein